MGRHEWVPRHRMVEPCLCRDNHDADCEATPQLGETSWGLVAIIIWVLFMGVLLVNG